MSVVTDIPVTIQCLTEAKNRCSVAFNKTGCLYGLRKA